MLLRPGGYMVSVGIPTEPTTLAGGHPALIAMRQINIAGSVTGTNKEVEEALDLTARGLVRPILTKGRLGDLEDMMHKMKAGKIAGRAVVQVSD
jgi:alcohol dehydrogenase, propanol-preferring